MEKDTENKIHDLLSSPAGKERTPQPTGAHQANTAELRPTPIIDLTAARERADARRKKLEAEQKRIEDRVGGGLAPSVLSHHVAYFSYHAVALTF